MSGAQSNAGKSGRNPNRRRLAIVVDSEKNVLGRTI